MSRQGDMSITGRGFHVWTFMDAEYGWSVRCQLAGQPYCMVHIGCQDITEARKLMRSHAVLKHGHRLAAVA